MRLPGRAATVGLTAVVIAALAISARGQSARHPVSGRVPEHFWPDCVTCAFAPETSMKNHGYLLPPD